MEARGIETVAELAEASGINRSHLYRLWGRDTEGTASLDLVRQLARGLRVTVAQLLGEEPLPEPTPYDTDPAIRVFVDALVALSPVVGAG
jgi:transcriptional regulator with XRE-family HTH domain